MKFWKTRKKLVAHVQMLEGQLEEADRACEEEMERADLRTEELANTATVLADALDQHVELVNLRKTLEIVEHEVALVYDHITGGRISKCNTLAGAVISEADERFNSFLKECVAEELEDELKQEIGLLIDAIIDGMTYDKHDEDDVLGLLDCGDRGEIQGVIQLPTDSAVWKLLRRAAVAFHASGKGETTT